MSCTTLHSFVDGDMNRLDDRLKYHKSGRGSKLLKAVAKKGIGFGIVRVWPEGDRNFERNLKNRKKAWKLCPICNPDN